MITTSDEIFSSNIRRILNNLDGGKKKYKIKRQNKIKTKKQMKRKNKKKHKKSIKRN